MPEQTGASFNPVLSTARQPSLDKNNHLSPTPFAFVSWSYPRLSSSEEKKMLFQPFASQFQAAVRIATDDEMVSVIQSLTRAQVLGTHSNTLPVSGPPSALLSLRIRHLCSNWNLKKKIILLPLRTELAG